ncbi:MAG: uroporphyrinogen-III synthase, partial [Caulobacteraceae bacterium]
ATAGRLRALGLGVIIEPLLEVRAVEGVEIDLDGVAALAFTSANAVAAFAARHAERDLPVFAVGDATAAAANAAGFARVESAGGDVAALAALLAERRAQLSGDVLYLAPSEPARDLVELLTARGVGARRVALYETVPLGPPAGFAAGLSRIDGVLVHSAKAAKALARFLGDHPAPRLHAYCLSTQAARPLADASLAAVRCADAPNETALLALIAAGRV